jgi:DNA repair protein RecN (Recombination protein N)
MLDELTVANLGIISDAAVEPGPGLVVFTGETGAGKTLLLGALRLLTGESARRDLVGPAGDEAEVAGRFLEDDDEFVAKRRVVAGGRSRAYIDDVMISAAGLAERTHTTVELVVQHDHLLIASPGGIRRLVDSAMGEAGREAAQEYLDTWESLRRVREAAGALGGDRRALQRELDMVLFQVDEIARAGFADGEDEELRLEAGRLRNHAAIAEGLAAAAQLLGSGSATGEALDQGVAELRRIATYDPALAGVATQADELVGAASELSREIGDAIDHLEHRPERLDQVERRLALLGDLRRKYGDTLSDVLAFGADAEARADELQGLLEGADNLERDLAAAEATVKAAGSVLSKQRRAVAERMARDTIHHLGELGFRSPVVDFTFREVAARPSGTDRIELAFASDASLTPGPAHRVASGGELSRLVLALRLSSGVSDMPVIAFDEIDAGIGGATALAMGRKLADLAQGRQVLCVTHLPQVAAFADRHFVVSRANSAAGVKAVSGDARLEELSRMLAGMPESERGIAHARELLETAAGR